MIRGNQKGPIETTAEILGAREVESSSEVSRSPSAIEVAEEMDEAGLT